MSICFTPYRARPCDVSEPQEGEEGPRLALHATAVWGWERGLPRQALRVSVDRLQTTNGCVRILGFPVTVRYAHFAP